MTFFKLFTFASSFICLAGFSNKIYATEVDNFTQRYNSALTDSTAKLNATTQQFFRSILDSTNYTNTGKVEDLYEIAFRKLSSKSPWGTMELYITREHGFDTQTIKRADSIYSNVSFFQGFGIFFASLGETFKFGKFNYGADKIGHYFQQGYEYYEIAYLQEKGWSAAMDNGEKQERGKFGLATTGVYSYGDLNSNFRGMFFWLLLAPTKYNQGYDTYIIRENNSWILNPNKTFSWESELNAGMDEALNCSTFSSENYTTAVQKKLNELEQKDPAHKYTCPVKPEACQEFADNFDFPEFKERLISPACLNAAN